MRIPVGGNIVPGDAFEAPQVNNSNLWGGRTGFGASSTIFESGLVEDSPELTQTISGLTPGNSYDVYGVYWTDQDENWSVRAGLTSVRPRRMVSRTSVSTQLLAPPRASLPR